MNNSVIVNSHKASWSFENRQYPSILNEKRPATLVFFVWVKGYLHCQFLSIQMPFDVLSISLTPSDYNLIPSLVTEKFFHYSRTSSPKISLISSCDKKSLKSSLYSGSTYSFSKYSRYFWLTKFMRLWICDWLKFYNLGMTLNLALRSPPSCSTKDNT